MDFQNPIVFIYVIFTCLFKIYKIHTHLAYHWTLNVTSAATNYVTVDAPTGLDLTAVAQGSSEITVQVLVGGHVVKTGTVRVTVGA